MIESPLKKPQQCALRVKNLARQEGNSLILRHLNFAIPVNLKYSFSTGC